MIYIVSMELISKSTHHPTNKKPHECGDFSLILSLWVGVINGISIYAAKTFDKPSFHQQKAHNVLTQQYRRIHSR